MDKLLHASIPIDIVSSSGGGGTDISSIQLMQY